MTTTRLYCSMVCALLTLMPVTEVFAYRLNARVYDTTEFPLRLAFVGDPPPSLTHEEVEQAIQHSIKQWNDVQCSDASIVYDGRRDTSDPADPKVIRLAFTQPGDDPCFPEAATLVGITADICTTSYLAVVLLNTRDYYWSKAPYEAQALIPSQSTRDRLVIDLPSTLTHELGHILGLAHPDTGLTPQNEKLATMVSTYKLDGGQATLSADDRFGLCAKYPKAGSLQTCTTQSECEQRLQQPGAICVTQDNVSVCDEPQGKLGDYCAVDTLHCAEDCYFSSPGVGVGYCTVACGDESPCPDSYTCSSNEGDTRKFCVLTGNGGDLESSCQHIHAKTPASLLLMFWGLLWLKRKRRPQRSGRQNT